MLAKFYNSSSKPELRAINLDLVFSWHGPVNDSLIHQFVSYFLNIIECAQIDHLGSESSEKPKE